MEEVYLEETGEFEPVINIEELTVYDKASGRTEFELFNDSTTLDDNQLKQLIEFLQKQID